MSTETMQEQTQATEAMPATPSKSVFRPVVDIVERADELAIVAEMPGVTAEQLEIHFEDGVLRLEGHVEPRRESGARYLLQEYGVGGFFREFQVSDVVDACGSRPNWGTAS